MAKKLIAECEHCHYLFLSKSVQMDEQMFHDTTISNTEPCQICQQLTKIDKSNLEFHEIK